MIYGSSLTYQVISQFRGHDISVSIDKSGSLIIYRREGASSADPWRRLLRCPPWTRYTCTLFTQSNQRSQRTCSSSSLGPSLWGPTLASAFTSRYLLARAYTSLGAGPKLIDSFGFRPYKYALYGTTPNGIVCRFYRTDLFPEVPKTEL